jgi:LmbE family N-acetylglucosaminyl deacetylase
MRRRLAIALLLLLAGVPLVAAVDPLRPAGSGGLATVERALARLDQHRRLLIVGAHPDDEDTTLLALVSLAQGGEAAYLSLTRGEGGQNLIGDELGEALGVLRTEELLAARRLDGGRQLFTRAYDFGYTESLEETLSRWPRELLLVDVVRAIRRFRPQVVVSVFPPDERAGHGQHQASGVLTAEAFRLAGDAVAFPELAAEGLPPWQPSLLFLEAWWNPEDATLEVPSAVLDPLSGHTVFQLAMASRSFHRSQSMGMLQGLEGRPVRLTLAAGASEATSLFAELDTTLMALAAHLPGGVAQAILAEHLEAVVAVTAAARDALTPARLEAAVPSLAAALTHLRAARRDLAASPSAATADGVHLDAFLAEKEAAATAGLVAAAGLVADATTSSAVVVPGESLPVAVRVWNGGSRPLRLVDVWLESPAGWSPPVPVVAGGSWNAAPPPAPGAAPAELPADGPPPSPALVAPGSLIAATPRVAVDAATPPTTPYFLSRPRRGDVYDVEGVDPGLLGEPFEPPPLLLRVDVELLPRADEEGSLEPVRLTIAREVVALARDLARGEVRRPLRAVPPLEVAVDPALLVWPLGDRQPRRLQVSLLAHGAARHGELVAAVPPEWPAVAPLPFALAAGERGTFTIEVAPPAELAPGRYVVGVAATEAVPRPPASGVAGAADDLDDAAALAADEVDPTVAGSEATAAESLPPAPARHQLALPLVDYEHVRARPVPVVSRVAVAAFPLALPPLSRVGYVRGAADDVPQALAAVGVPIELLAPGDLQSPHLGGFDAIVVGSRAYESVPGLTAANPALLDYVRRGGLLVVQFQRWEYFQQGLAPVQMTMGRRGAGRTTDETAPVRLLVPEHRVFARPNEIGPTDWEGWVQERGLYYPDSWDDALLPLLAMADPGEPELEGALLVAPHGDGRYVYTGLAFFRQLPAGVPGAYRLFANLLALAEPQVESEDLPFEELEGGPRY